MKGEEVKRVLKAAGFTQKDLADKFGTTTQNISDRLGKDDISTGFLERISSATGIPLSSFYPNHWHVMAYSQNQDSPIVPDSVIQLLAKKDEQIDRLLAIIEKLSK